MAPIPPHRSDLPPLPPFGQQLGVQRALLILPETIRERVPQTIQAEMIRAPLVRAVQKRAMKALVRHATPSASDAFDIGRAMFQT
jgi:hypothetical protein